jgi:hypothetical protein
MLASEHDGGGCIGLLAQMAVTLLSKKITFLFAFS